MGQTISSRQNQWVKKLNEAARGKGIWKDCCIPEGVKLCREAAGSGLKIEAVFSTEALAGEAASLGDSETQRFVLSESLFKSVSDTMHPQGILCLAKRPPIRPLEALDLKAGPASILVLETIQDPGNLGTMIRTAEAMGWDAAVTAGDCADPFQSKALRAAMGSSFRLPLYKEKESRKIIRYCRAEETAVLAAAAEGTALPVFRRPERLSLWIGNEGRGLPQEILDAADQRLSIPMPGGAESLNAAAAAAILLYKLREPLL